MAVMKAKVPTALASGIACLLLGGGIGAVTVWATMGKQDQQANAAPVVDDGKGDAKGGKAGPPGMGGGMGGMGGGMGGGGKKGGGGAPGGGGGKGPSPKVQLAQLVNKLDTVTSQSLHIELNADQKKQVKELLAGLAEKDEISDEDAKAKLDALLKLLEPNKKVMEDAGYRWPGGGGGGFGGFGGGMGGGGPPANPFKEGAGAEHLKSLQATVGK